jgi:hypothetical protein
VTRPTSFSITATSSRSETLSALEITYWRIDAGPRRRCTGGRGLDDRELAARELRIVAERGAQRPRRCELGQQQLAPPRFVQLPVSRRHVRLAQQLLDHLLVDLGVLPQVDGREVEAESRRCLAQHPQPPVGEELAAARAQARVDHVEGGRELAALAYGRALATAAAMREPQPELLRGREEARVDPVSARR